MAHEIEFSLKLSSLLVVLILFEFLFQKVERRRHVFFVVVYFVEDGLVVDVSLVARNVFEKLEQVGRVFEFGDDWSVLVVHIFPLQKVAQFVHLVLILDLLNEIFEIALALMFHHGFEEVGQGVVGFPPHLLQYLVVVAISVVGLHEVNELFNLRWVVQEVLQIFDVVSLHVCNDAVEVHDAHFPSSFHLLDQGIELAVAVVGVEVLESFFCESGSLHVEQVF